MLGYDPLTQPGGAVVGGYDPLIEPGGAGGYDPLTQRLFLRRQCCQDYLNQIITKIGSKIIFYL